MTLRDDMDIGWFDQWHGTEREPVMPITEKGWVTIHGHPVLIGGGGSKGGGGGGGGGGGSKANRAAHTSGPVAKVDQAALADELTAQATNRWGKPTTQLNSLLQQSGAHSGEKFSHMEEGQVWSKTDTHNHMYTIDHGKEGPSLKYHASTPISGRGGSVGGDKPSKGGPGGSATDGALTGGHTLKPDQHGVDPAAPHTYPTSQHAGRGSLETWNHGIIDTPSKKDVHVRFQPTSKYMGGEKDRIAYEGPGGLRGTTKITNANMRPARPYTKGEHEEVDYGQSQASAAASTYSAGFNAPATASTSSKKPKHDPTDLPFTKPATYDPKTHGKSGK